MRTVLVHISIDLPDGDDATVADVEREIRDSLRSGEILLADLRWRIALAEEV